MPSWRPCTVLPPVPGLPCPTPAAMLAAPLAPEYAESCRAGSCQDCFLLSPQNSGICVLPRLRQPLAPGDRAPLLPSVLHAAGDCPSGPSSRVLQQCRCRASTADARGEVPQGDGTVLLPGGHSLQVPPALGRCHPAGTGSLLSPQCCPSSLGASVVPLRRGAGRSLTPPRRWHRSLRR